MNVRALLAALALAFAQTAFAVENNCIQDVWKAHNNSQNLTCSAKDVTPPSGGWIPS